MSFLNTIDYLDIQTVHPKTSMERVDSGETDDSPFTSNLVTPTDEQTLPVHQRTLNSSNSSIDERIIIAKAARDYFSSGEPEDNVKDEPGDVDLPTTISQESCQNMELAVEKIVGRGGDEQTDVLADDRDGDISALSTFDSSPSFPSPHPSEIELLAQARRRSSAFYTLPNAHIEVEKVEPSSDLDEVDDTILQEEYSPLLDDSEPTADLLFSLSWPVDIQTWMGQLTIRGVFTVTARMLLFLPWCIAVGGAILLSPEHLSSIGFASRLNYILAPSTGIERYAHWANYGLQHVTIFLGFVVTLLWMFPNGGFTFLGALVAQFCWAWHDFLPDSTVAIGDNERQTVYLLAKYTWLRGITAGLKTVDGKFYVAHLGLESCGSESSDSDLDDSGE